MKRLQEQWPVILIILLCIVSRLPQLLSPELLLDGDECVMGLMAKHLNEGKEFPLFFHGQAYGFSLIETGLVSLFYLFCGMNDIAVKLPMLLLWTAGIVFFYKTLSEMSKGNKWLPLFFTLVFIFSPAWAVWSMKARGGYLTAFLFSSLLTWIVFRKKGIASERTYFFIGLILVIIYQSQPLWLPGLLPVLLYKLYPELNKKKILAVLAGIIPLGLIFLFAAMHTSSHWAPKVFELDIPTFTNNLALLPDRLFHHFNGYYYLYYVYQPPLAAWIYGGMALVLVLVPILVMLWYLFREYKEHKLFLISGFSILFTIGYTLFLIEETPRYLLPLTGFVLFALFILADKMKRAGISIVASVAFIIAGIPAVVSFKDYIYFPARREEVLTSVEYMQDRDIKYCFSNDGLLQWQIMFYSKEKVLCRESSKDDRYPEYVEAVTNAYYKDRKHLCIIDNTTDLRSIAHEKAVNVISHFYIVIDPGDEVIKDMEFKL